MCVCECVLFFFLLAFGNLLLYLIFFSTKEKEFFLLFKLFPLFPMAERKKPYLNRSLWISFENIVRSFWLIGSRFSRFGFVLMRSKFFVRLSLSLTVFRLTTELFAAATCSIRFGWLRDRKRESVRACVCARKMCSMRRMFLSLDVGVWWWYVRAYAYAFMSCGGIECGEKSEKQ